MFTQLLMHLNWLHILVATLAYFALGALWYSKVLFVAPWIKGHGINVSHPNASKGLAGIMIGSFLLMLSTTIGVAILQYLVPLYKVDAQHALKFGLMIGILFSFCPISVGYLYTKKPLALHLIDGFYHTTGIVIVSLILALWK